MIYSPEEPFGTEGGTVERRDDPFWNGMEQGDDPFGTGGRPFLFHGTGGLEQGDDPFCSTGAGAEQGDDPFVSAGLS